MADSFEEMWYYSMAYRVDNFVTTVYGIRWVLDLSRSSLQLYKCLTILLYT